MLTDSSVCGPLKKPQRGSLGFAAITGTTPATANTLVTLSYQRQYAIFENPSNADVVITVDGADFIVLRAGVNHSLPLIANGYRLDAGQVIGVYQRSGAPSSGEVLVQVF